MIPTFLDSLPGLVGRIVKNYETEENIFNTPGRTAPDRTVMARILSGLQSLLFPGWLGQCPEADPAQFVGSTLLELYRMLCGQVRAALICRNPENLTGEEIELRAGRVCQQFFDCLPQLRTRLLHDVQAAFDGDPAAGSREEILLAYPGLLAVFIYRLAHELQLQQVPLLPRIMTEYAHGCTGIDINPGAQIGEYFFMDHGTGIVIGETTVIGSHVKLYQGVTLGARSTASGRQLSGVKRHPTIEDHVTIYANASILGGDTVVGANSVIGSGALITGSIPANTKVGARYSDLMIPTQRPT